MGEITFILGGARSGKSAYAVKLAKANKKVAFIATCIPKDKDMKKRVELHKKHRPSDWCVFEEPNDIASLLKLKKLGSKFDIIIVDCLTLFVSSLLLQGLKSELIEGRINQMIEGIKSAKCKFIIVSNEVGLGIHPRTSLGRKFRDLAGRINQMVAKKSDNVFFMVSGLPLKVKACLPAGREESSG